MIREYQESKKISPSKWGCWAEDAMQGGTGLAQLWKQQSKSKIGHLDWGWVPKGIK